MGSLSEESVWAGLTERDMGPRGGGTSYQVYPDVYVQR